MAERSREPKGKAALRVFQLAKELGVDSKQIVWRCMEADISDLTNHMSVVSPDLAALIRVWFREGDGQAK